MLVVDVKAFLKCFGNGKWIWGAINVEYNWTCLLFGQWSRQNWIQDGRNRFITNSQVSAGTFGIITSFHIACKDPSTEPQYTVWFCYVSSSFISGQVDLLKELTAYSVRSLIEKDSVTPPTKVKIIPNLNLVSVPFEIFFHLWTSSSAAEVFCEFSVLTTCICALAIFIHTEGKHLPLCPKFHADAKQW